MIIGIGTDLLEIARMKKIILSPTGDRFLERVLTSAEQELAQLRKGRVAEFVSGRFTAKEAIVKALGCGLGKMVGFQDIEVLPDALGKPECKLSPAAVERLGLTDAFRIHLSITHSESLAAAYAVVERL